MFKQISYTICTTALCLLCVSCASLKCKHFPGTQQMVTEKELSTKSVWKYGDEIYHVQVVSSNKVVATGVGWDRDVDSHYLEPFEVVASKLDDTLFLNVKKEGMYTILRVVPAGKNSMVLLTIDTDKVMSDFEQNKIKGSKEGGDYTLDCTKKELDEYIKANLNTLFSLEAAGVLELIEGEMN